MCNTVLFAVALLTPLTVFASGQKIPACDESFVLNRIDNLRKKYAEASTGRIDLPESDYGPNAVSSGDSTFRFIALQNPARQKRKCSIRLNRSIGLARAETVELRQLYPTEKIIGLYRYNPGYYVTFYVPPCRAALLLATTKPLNEISVYGCDYQLVRDNPGKGVVIDLLAPPGSRRLVTVTAPHRKFKNAILDGAPRPDAADGKPFYVSFGGEPNTLAAHRKLGALKPVDVPEEAETLCPNTRPARKAYRLSTTITEAAPNTLLAIPLEAGCNRLNACAFVRISGKSGIASFATISIPDSLRHKKTAPAVICPAFYVPVTADIIDKKINIFLLLHDDSQPAIKPECYITAYPHPYESKRLILE